MATSKPPNKNLLRALLAITMALLVAGVATAVIRSTDDDESETATGQGTSTTSRATTTTSEAVATTGPASTVVPAVPVPTSSPVPVPTTAVVPGPTGTAVAQATTTTSRPASATTTTPPTTAAGGAGTATTTTTFVFGRNEHPDTGEQVPLGIGLALTAAGVVGLMASEALRSRRRRFF